jgi:hypothetical protein
LNHPRRTVIYASIGRSGFPHNAELWVQRQRLPQGQAQLLVATYHKDTHFLSTFQSIERNYL